MIQQHDAYDLTRRFDLCGDVDVAGRGFEAAAGVIMGDDDGGGAVCKCIGEDFARMYGAAVNQANRHYANFQNLVRAVTNIAEGAE